HGRSGQEQGKLSLSMRWGLRVRRAEDSRALSRTTSNGTPHRLGSHGPAVAPTFFYVPEWGRRDLVNREQFYAAMSGEGTLDYELYLNTKTLLRLYQPIWNSFKENYLDKHGLNVKKIYDSEYSHDDAYVVAEALAEFDELFQKFRYEHMQLIHRTIGFGSNSLKGRPVEILEEGMRHKFYPELWEIRSHMTDAWGAVYGMKRDSLGGLHGEAGAFLTRRTQFSFKPA